MSIRRKLFLLLTSVAVIFGIALVGLWQFERGRLAAIEKLRIRERSDSLDRFLKQWEGSLESFIITTAVIPSFEQAVVSGDREGVAAQISEESAGLNRVGVIWVYRADGSILYSGNRLYADRLDEAPVPRDAVATLFKDGNRFARFFTKMPAGVLEVVGLQVIAGGGGANAGPVSGYLFAGRLWNDEELKAISLHTGNTMRLVETSYQERQLVLPSGEIAFTRPLNGWDGNPVARLLARNDSPLLRHVNRLRTAVWLLMFGFAASMTFVTALAVKRWVIRPLRNLVHSLRTESPRTVKGLDRERGEVGEIARLIWTFFEQREGLIKELGERRQTEREIRGSERQSVVEQRIESIGRLAAGVAHDFNNLLTTIIGYTGMLQERFKDDPTVRGELDHIMTAGERATVLTKRLLAFSRKQVLHPRVVDLNGMLAQKTPEISAIIGDRIELRFDAEASQGSVRADPTQIEQVILSLANNARDAMPDGGILTISTKDTLIPERTHYQGLDLPAGSYVTMEVSDTGVGMDEATKERIFEPFFTTKTSANGLGLAMVYGVVQQSGGAISVSSTPGAGTTFLVHLPMVAVEPASLEQAPKPVRSNPKRRDETALVLLADRGVLDLVTSVLNEQGLRVLPATTGAEAMALARNHHGEMRLMISDLLLPEGSAIPISDEVKVEHPETELLFLSGVADEIEQAVRIASQLDILEKPFTPSELNDRVRTILRGRVASTR
jgi:signal transduction histidine kinase